LTSEGKEYNNKKEPILEVLQQIENYPKGKKSCKFIRTFRSQGKPIKKIGKTFEK
jgi:hypothetical protein